MSVAHVGHVKDDLYSASIEYDAEAPFGYVIGPTDVSVDEAVAWARRRATAVIVRTEGAIYSAGEVAKGDLPVWPAEEAVPHEPAPRVEADELWRVEGHLGSRAADLEPVALRLQEAVGRDERASDARHSLHEWGLAVTFTICCSAAECYELGSSILRESWAAAGISESRIHPFSTSSVAVRAATARA
jgi:hypothetical protein